MKRVLTVGALPLLALVLALPVRAIVLTVTRTDDHLDGYCDGHCTLREAIAAANGIPGLDVVQVPAGIYELTRTGAGEDANQTGDLDIAGDLILVGAGAGSTIIDGAGADRVLDIQTRAEIFGVTIRNGRVNGDGGGVFARPVESLDNPPVVLHRVVVSGNQARSGGHGGGIASRYHLEIRDSAILDNQAEGDGGGIATIFLGSFALTNVTVSGNSAGRYGGGLYYRFDGAVIIAGSTIAFNRAELSGGGIYSRNPLFPGIYGAQLAGSIVAANTALQSPDCAGASSLGYNVVGVAGVCALGPTDRSGTEASPLDPRLAPLTGQVGPTPIHGLFAGSPALNFVTAELCQPADQAGQRRSAPCEAGAWEALEDPSCVPGGPALCLQNGRFRVTAAWQKGANPADAQAVPLTDDTGTYWFFSPDNLELMVKVLDGCALNGHWWVFSSGMTDVGVALKVEDLETSLAWTNTHPAGGTYAPRLDTRALDCSPAGPQVVAAAVPATPPTAVLIVTKTEDGFDGACDYDCSLREAIAAAKSRKGETTVIVLGPGVYPLSRGGRGEDLGGTGDLDLTESVVLLGAGADRTFLDGGGIDRVLEIHPGVRLDLVDATVRNGWAAGPSFNDGSGGGIFARGSLWLLRSSITANRADAAGGGIWAADLVAFDSTVSANEARFEGGGIVSHQLHLLNATVSGNRAGGQGGGIFHEFSDAILTHVTVTGNRALIGGGLVVWGADCPGPACLSRPWIERTIIAGNSADSEPDCNFLLHEGDHNVFGVGDGCSPRPTDLAGTASQPLDPRLSPLGNHGGPTPTHVPVAASSPAVDRAPCAAGSDQRGRLRPADGRNLGQGFCDAGAVERLPACQPDENTLCLGFYDRFYVRVKWAAQGNTGVGHAVPLALDTGAFWFFDPANLELTVKVLDGCDVNDRFWVFLAGLTDIGVEVSVGDTRTGAFWTYTHTAGTPLRPRLDTNALDACL